METGFDCDICTVSLQRGEPALHPFVSTLTAPNPADPPFAYYSRPCLYGKPTMNKSAESLQREIAAIKQLLSSVDAAVDAYADVAIKNVGRTSISDAGEVAEKQTALFMETSKLLRTVRGPVDMVFSNFENVS
jgi:hypothetical protein